MYLECVFHYILIRVPTFEEISKKKLPAKWNNRSKHKSSSGTLSEVCSKASANPAARPKYCTLWVLLDNSIGQLQRELIRPRQKTLNRSVAGLSKA